MKVSVYRKAHFNAAHRIYNPAWTDSKNFEIFGPCSNPNFHGHNYNIIIKLTGEVNPQTGYVYDLRKLKKLIKEEVLDRLDHKNLNVEVKEFKNLIPTAEHICIVIYNLLRSKLDLKYEIKVRLYETERNFVEYPV